MSELEIVLRGLMDAVRVLAQNDIHGEQGVVTYRDLLSVFATMHGAVTDAIAETPTGGAA
jgi:hypothetical protein